MHYYLDYFHFGEQKGESITKNSLDNVRSDISVFTNDHLEKSTDRGAEMAKQIDKSDVRSYTKHNCMNRNQAIYKER